MPKLFERKCKTIIRGLLCSERFFGLLMIFPLVSHGDIFKHDSNVIFVVKYQDHIMLPNIYKYCQSSIKLPQKTTECSLSCCQLSINIASKQSKYHKKRWNAVT